MFACAAAVTTTAAPANATTQQTMVTQMRCAGCVARGRAPCPTMPERYTATAATVVFALGAPMNDARIRAFGRWLLGGAVVLAGVGHLTAQREEFRAQVPERLPADADLVVVVSGLWRSSSASP
jgi:hypothetical protein